MQHLAVDALQFFEQQLVGAAHFIDPAALHDGTRLLNGQLRVDFGLLDGQDTASYFLFSMALRASSRRSRAKLNSTGDSSAAPARSAASIAASAEANTLGAGGAEAQAASKRNSSNRQILRHVG